MTERVTVQVWLKEAVLDPQGQAVQKALTREGLPGVKSVRQGKVFFIEFQDDSGRSQEDLNQLIEKLARDLLSNPVIEDFQEEHPAKLFKALGIAVGSGVLAHDVLDGFDDVGNIGHGLGDFLVNHDFNFTDGGEVLIAPAK